MRGQALGFLNEDPVVTPHLDRLAKESLVLPNAVSNYPLCSPFRAMFMTGKYPHANRVTSNCNSETDVNSGKDGRQNSGKDGRFLISANSLESVKHELSFK